MSQLSSRVLDPTRCARFSRAMRHGDFRGAGDISRLFGLSFASAAARLDGADVAQLLRAAAGTFDLQGWTPETAALDGLILRWADRGEHHRQRLRDAERKELCGILGAQSASWSARNCFAIARLLDEHFADRLGAHPHLHPTVTLVPKRFLSEIENPPPAIGQMTRSAACRRHMRTFWFVGDTERMDGFGAIPRPQEVVAPNSLVEALRGACETDELRVALVCWRQHVNTDLTRSVLGDRFAITSLNHRAPAGTLAGVLDKLRKAKVHLALFPEIAFDDEELCEAKSLLKSAAARFPCLTVAGVAHRRIGSSHVNEAIGLDRLGEEIFRHEKLEPFQAADKLIEDIIPRVSTSYAYLDSPVGRVVVNVCKDVRSDVPMFLNRLLGATVLLVPAYSQRLDFTLEEAALLGARQGTIMAAVNPPTQLRDAAAIYAPIKGTASAVRVAQSLAPPGTNVQVHQICINRALGNGTIRAETPVWV